MKFPNLPGPSAIAARAALEHLNKLPMPPLGDRANLYAVKLTEPEINSIYAAVAFVRSEAETLEQLAGGAAKMGFWAHYGPTLNGLSDRLSAEFDSTAPGSPGEPPAESMRRVESGE